MSKRKFTTNDMVAKSKKEVIACSTPEHRVDSPSRDSDSICDSDAGSPVPFLCTQDGAEGTDVVWNYYTPKPDKGISRSKNTTPLRRKSRKMTKLIEKPLAKRRPVRQSQKRLELFQDLVELNQNLHEIIGRNSETNIDKPASCSEEDIFSDTGESSPKSGLKTKNRCLRKNVLSSKFKKPEHEIGLESDDSMNECLLKASQAVEENINYDSAPKMSCFEVPDKQTYLNSTIDPDSMDTILSSVKLESPYLNKAKKCISSRFNNDSFDNLLGGLNDSALERLSQMPIKDIKKASTNDSNWVLQDVLDESQFFKTTFTRHNSMPESPSCKHLKQQSTSSTSLGRYSSMPFNKSDDKIIVPGDSPIQCTPEEIKKKHQHAREKLLAKRLLPFTASQQSSHLTSTQTQGTEGVKPIKKSFFQPRIATTKALSDNKTKSNITTDTKSKDKVTDDCVNIKLIIEKKRQEALMKLRRRLPK